MRFIFVNRLICIGSKIKQNITITRFFIEVTYVSYFLICLKRRIRLFYQRSGDEDRQITWRSTTFITGQDNFSMKMKQFDLLHNTLTLQPFIIEA